MSRFNYYAQKMDRIARAAFEEYKRAAEKQKRADEHRKLFPQRHGIIPADYAAASTRAQADYLEAVNDVEIVRRKMTEGEYAQQIEELRRTLADDVAVAYSINPRQVDSNALELLKSGIMDTKEYKTMLTDALRSGNITMARLVGKYAGEAAEALAKDGLGGNDANRAALRAIEVESRQHAGGPYLEAFDMLRTTFDRCTNNPYMIDAWGELTQATVENF